MSYDTPTKELDELFEDALEIITAIGRMRQDVDQADQHEALIELRDHCNEFIAELEHEIDESEEEDEE